MSYILRHTHYIPLSLGIHAKQNKVCGLQMLDDFSPYDKKIDK